MRGKTLILLAVTALAGFPLQAKAAPITTGAAGNFAVLGGSAVTNTGSSVFVNGHVGSSPTPAVNGFPPGLVTNGILYTAADPVTAQAHTDLIAAYTAAQNAPGGTGPTDLGNATLTPGVYTYSSAAPWTSGALTLNGLGDPNAQWIFQIGSTLITPSGASVVLINGASPDHVFWQVGSSATLGTTSTFAGSILAQTSITLNGGTLHGRALAIDGAVTITAAETVNVPEPGTLLLLVSGLASLFASKRRPISVA
jgi:hypothetical protein